MKTTKFITLLIVIVLCNCAAAKAAFDDIAGLNGTKVSLKNNASIDIDYASRNPALLNCISNSVLSFTGGKPYLGLNEYEITDMKSTYIQQIKKVTFSLSYFSRNNQIYKEEDTLLGFSAPLSKLVLAGINIHSRQQSYILDRYTSNDPLFTRYGTSAQGFACDAGVYLDLGKSLLGLSVDNVYSSAMGLEIKEEPYKIYRLNLITGSCLFEISSINKDYQIEMQKHFSLANILDVYPGVIIGSRELKTISFSFGTEVFHQPAIRLDYSTLYNINGSMNNLFGTHRISIGIIW